MSETFDTNPEMELLCLHVFEKSNGNIIKKTIKDEYIDITEKTEEEE